MAGARAARLTKEREQQRAEYEAVKNKIKEDNAVGLGRIDDKFNSGSDSLEQEFRRRTVGLVSAEDFRKAREYVDEAKTEGMLKQAVDQKMQEEKKKKERAEKRKKLNSALSFEVDDDAGGGEGGDHEDEIENSSSSSTSSSSSSSSSSRPFKRVTKDPTVDTAYLPDKDRDEAMEAEKDRLRADWQQQQEVVKNEQLQVVYSYWDGAGHRKAIQIRKGTTVGRFLELVKAQIGPEFREIRELSPDNLIYVKEDLIIPHHFSFYDLIVTKARGKSGPLFHFDVHDDVRCVCVCGGGVYVCIYMYIYIYIYIRLTNYLFIYLPN